MSVAQPDFLLVFNESSGTSVTNYGTQSGGYSISGSGFTWSQNNGLWTASGKLIGTSNTSTMPSLTTSATGPGTGLDSINCAIAFKLTSLVNGSAKIVMPGSSTSDGNIRITADTPSGSGDFDLSIDFRHTGGAGTTAITYTGLSFGTVYQVACALDCSTVSAVVPRAKLNSGSSANGSSANFTSFGFENSWPRLLHRSDFETGAFAFNGEIYYLAYERTSTPWALSDLTSINADPTTTITGWPGGGSSTTASPGVGAVTMQGRTPTTSAFSNVRIREVLVNASGQAVGSLSNIGLRVWYAGIPIGAPDVSLNSMTTDAAGTASWSIATGSLAFNQAIFYVAYSSDTSASIWTCARLTPNYE